jgi:hypothetical protein
MFDSWIIPLLTTLLLFSMAVFWPCHGDTFKKLDRIIFVLIAFSLSVVAWALWLVSGFAL